MDLALELIKLVAVGLIAGLFSSILANRDHRQRKWWELRVQAYQHVIEALSDLVYYYDKHYNAEMEYRQLPDDFKARLSENWNTSFPRLRKLADSGAFLFSDRANAALKEVMRDDHEDSYIDMLDNNLSRARKCLTELVACSKTDLRLKNKWLDTWR